MLKKYIVRLTEKEREELSQLINTGKAAAYKRCHAQILLKADVSDQGDGWTDLQISQAFDITTRTVERVRQRLVKGGLDAAINRAKQSRVRKRCLDGEQEAHLVALSCSEPPEGRSRWTLQLLADKMIELSYVETISDDTVQRVLKKTK
jgi:transposase